MREQDHGIDIQHIEKDVVRHAAGATGRQIERGLGEPFRLRARTGSLDQRAIDQRGDDGAQKRR